MSLSNQVVQFAAAALAFYQLGMLSGEWLETNGVLVGGLLILLALIVYVGATNVINFMDGINGITAGYALAVLVPLFLLNTNYHELSTNCTNGFVDNSLVICAILSVLVFCIFNFRPKGKAKCFAGDVGSIGIAFILLFLIGKVIIATGDLTYLVLSRFASFPLSRLGIVQASLPSALAAPSVPAGLWRGWCSDHLPSHHAA